MKIFPPIPLPVIIPQHLPVCEKPIVVRMMLQKGNGMMY